MFFFYKMNRIKIEIIILLFFAVYGSVCSQVRLEISAGILVETENDVWVEIDGSLTEVNGGYFKGKISSGVRTDETSFAGFSFANGFNGIITRITGKSYSKGNDEPNNFKRYYELKNTGNSALKTDITIDCIMTGTNDESNGLSAPYHIYSYTTGWKGYGNGNSSSPVTADNVTIPTGNSDWIISDNSGIVSVDGEESLPTRFELYQNYPNPFNPTTTIKYAIPNVGIKNTQSVRLIVYDILGKVVAILVNKKQPPGYYEVEWNAGDLPSGIYFYKLRCGNFVRTKKLALLK